MADQNRVLLILMGQLLAEVRALRQLQEASAERERSMGRPLTPMSCLVEAAEPVLPFSLGGVQPCPQISEPSPAQGCAGSSSSGPANPPSQKGLGAGAVTP